MITLLTHDGSWRSLTDGDALGIYLIGIAVREAQWYDWLGVVGLVAFVSHFALRPFIESDRVRNYLEGAALLGALLILAVIIQWAW